MYPYVHVISTDNDHLSINMTMYGALFTLWFTSWCAYMFIKLFVRSNICFSCRCGKPQYTSECTRREYHYNCTLCIHFSACDLYCWCL